MPVFAQTASAFKRALAAFAVAVALASCATAPVVVAEGLSAAELTQRAQDAYERGRYDDAALHYQALRERFPDDPSAQCAADYEISFIRYKQKRYEEAKTGFLTLLERYKSADAALLPAHYKVLGEKVLSKIELEKK